MAYALEWPDPHVLFETSREAIRQRREAPRAAPSHVSQSLYRSCDSQFPAKKQSSRHEYTVLIHTAPAICKFHLIWTVQENNNSFKTKFN